MNVNLWFARDNNNEIVSILESNNDKDYSCPICTSKVIPKALGSSKVTPHFAHIILNEAWIKKTLKLQVIKWRIIIEK